MYTQGSTHLFENVNPPGHYKEITGVKNKLLDFTLWRRLVIPIYMYG